MKINDFAIAKTKTYLTLMSKVAHQIHTCIYNEVLLD